MLDRPERELALSVFYHDSYLKINASVLKRGDLLVCTFADKATVMIGKCAGWTPQNELRHGAGSSLVPLLGAGDALSPATAPVTTPVTALSPLAHQPGQE